MHATVQWLAFSEVSFSCPNCGAVYQIVKIEAGPETANREVMCQACDAFFGREAKVVVKYFMLRKGLKRQKAQK